MKRKALLYTAFAVLAVASVIFVLSLQFRSSWVSTSIKEKIRGDELTYLYQDLMKDGERAIYIAGKRATIAVINYELSNGTFFENANETIANTTLDGVIEDEPQPIMENTTLIDWLEKINNLFSYRKLNASVSFQSLSVTPEDFFTLEFSAEVRINLYDKMIDASVNRTTIFRNRVSLIGIEDPYNTIKSIGFIMNVFRECDFVNGSIADSSEAYGRAYKDFSTTDFSSIPDKSKYVLVTDTIDGKSNYEDFAAIITSMVPASSTTAPHVFGVVDIELILNKSWIVKYGDKIYLTNIIYEKNNSCYFPWSSAPSLLDRLEGRDSPDPKYYVNGRSAGIASFIAVQYFPQDLIKTSETHVLDYQYYSLY